MFYLSYRCLSLVSVLSHFNTIWLVKSTSYLRFILILSPHLHLDISIDYPPFPHTISGALPDKGLTLLMRLCISLVFTLDVFDRVQKMSRFEILFYYHIRQLNHENASTATDLDTWSSKYWWLLNLSPVACQIIPRCAYLGWSNVL